MRAQVGERSYQRGRCSEPFGSESPGATVALPRGVAETPRARMQTLLAWLQSCCPSALLLCLLRVPWSSPFPSTVIHSPLSFSLFHSYVLLDFGGASQITLPQSLFHLCTVHTAIRVATYTSENTGSDLTSTPLKGIYLTDLCCSQNKIQTL